MLIKCNGISSEGYLDPKYTCDAGGLPPLISFDDIPERTVTLTVVLYDPDAPSKTFIHWIVYNIPPDTLELASGTLPDGSRQGLNDFGRISYGPPCPPTGTHRYIFKALALDKKLDLPDGPKITDLESAMRGHILDQCEVIGRYSRR